MLMTAPSEVVNASPPGPSRAMPVNWHLRCVLRIGWLGFPRVGKLYTGTFRFQESNDQSCCKTEAFALTTGLVVLFPQAGFHRSPHESHATGIRGRKRLPHPPNLGIAITPATLDSRFMASSWPTRSGLTITAVTFNLRYLLLNCRPTGAYLLVRQMQIPRRGRACARRLRR